MAQNILIGTRASTVALKQAEQLAKKLRELYPSYRFTVKTIRTTGDRLIASPSLHKKAGSGLFVKEIERALLKREIHIAVHALKHVPTELSEGLVLAAIPTREDPADIFVGKRGSTLEKLEPGSLIGTSSLRRHALIRSLYPRVGSEELLGNLDARLEKLMNPRSKLVGVIVAAAGFKRLYESEGRPIERLEPHIFVPAPGQGALALEIRARDKTAQKLVLPLHDETTAAAVEAERALLRRLEGHARLPLGIYAEPSDDGLLRVTVFLGFPDGSRVIRESLVGSADDTQELVTALETVLRSQGSDEIVQALGIRRPAVPRSRR